MIEKTFWTGLSKLFSTCPEEHGLGINVCFQKLCCFCIFSDIEWKRFTIMVKEFWPSGYTVSAGLSKLPSTLSEEQFEGNFFPRKKNTICWHFRSLIDKNLGICRTILDVALQSDFYVNWGTHWEKKQILKK